MGGAPEQSACKVVPEQYLSSLVRRDFALIAQSGLRRHHVWLATTSADSQYGRSAHNTQSLADDPAEHHLAEVLRVCAAVNIWGDMAASRSSLTMAAFWAAHVKDGQIPPYLSSINLPTITSTKTLRTGLSGLFWAVPPKGISTTCTFFMPFTGCAG
ncbi:hypothetical protein GB937_000688 [Aspergillus fischeri]|nr:hypothetical protein GB937_000688 [Aspergillus fischeri]